MRVRMRVTTSACGFCGFCGSVSQTVDIACFSRFLACGSLVVLWSCGSLVVFGSRVAHCASETGKAANSHAHGHRSRGDARHVRVAHCVRDGYNCAHEPPQKPQKLYDVVFVELVVFAGLVVFGRACGFCRACGSPLPSRDRGRTE